MSTIKPSEIHIIGLGVSEVAQFEPSALAALCSVDLVIGSDRQLATVAAVLELKNSSAAVQILPRLAELKSFIENSRAKKIAILASGDPLFFGIGRWLKKQFDAPRLTFYPAISSVQVACHRLGLSLQDVTVLSLHGRPLETLRTVLRGQSTLIILTDKLSSPVALAGECAAAGFEQSTLTVCENLGYSQERLREFSVEQLLQPSTAESVEFDPLHITVITVSGRGGGLPQFPGIPDEHFMTGERAGRGMISKREVRLLILSFMQPGNDDVIWDVGAGCGGVAVELALWGGTAAVYAIEQHPQRLQYLATNRSAFGVVGNLHIVEGVAPDCLAKLPIPNKVFIGGSGGKLLELLQLIWSRLPIGGLLVASAVVASTKNTLVAFAETLADEQVESAEVVVKRGKLIQKKLAYTEKLPVEIFKFTKTETQIQEGDH